MPLYTYVATYKGESFVAQGQHSNYVGFASTWAALPAAALAGLPQVARKALARDAYRTDFSAVPNRTHVWTKTMQIDEFPMVVYAIQTEA